MATRVPNHFTNLLELVLIPPPVCLTPLKRYNLFVSKNRDLYNQKKKENAPVKAPQSIPMLTGVYTDELEKLSKSLRLAFLKVKDHLVEEAFLSK